MSLILPSLMTGQPQQVAQLRANYPPPTFAFNAALGIVDLVKNAAITRSNVTLVPGTDGIGAATLSAGVSDGFYVASALAAKTTPFSVMLIVKPGVSAATIGLFQWAGTTGESGTPHALIQNDSTNLKIYGSASGYVAAQNGALPAGALKTIVLTYDGVNAYLSCNGIETSAATPWGVQTKTHFWIGNGYLNSSTSQAVLAAAVWNGVALNRAAAKYLSVNGWNLFKAPSRKIWINAAGGAVALAGNANAIASATGALSTSVPLAGAAVGVATATGALSTALPLSGAAAAVATASGNMTLGIALSGAAIAQAVASGALGAGFALSGGAQAIAAATGAMSIQIALQGAAVAQAQATGALSVSGASSLAGDAVAHAAASGSLSISIPLSGAAQVVASATGNLGTGTPISGAAVAVAAASGNLLVTINLSGAAVAQAIAAGGLAIQVPLAGTAIAHVSANGALSGSDSVIPPGPERYRIFSMPRSRAVVAGNRQRIAVHRP